MRIAVVTTQVPFISGGAEIHAHALCQALREVGHEVELISIPFKWYPPDRIFDHLMACRMLDLSESCGVPIDRLIGLKFPAYHVPHPCKVQWILHQYRSAYDLWQVPGSDLAGFPEGREIRDGIDHADRTWLPEARAIFANSGNVARRLSTYSGIRAQPLYHPPLGAELFRWEEDRDPFLFFPSRLNTLKRQELVLRALARTRYPVRVVFAGSAESPAYGQALRRLAAEERVEGRVEWAGMVDEERKRDLYARCRGVLYVPFDEDYGYVTLESMLASKPVITCEDSGGPLEFIRDGEEGLVARPDADSLASAMDRVWNEVGWARQAGRCGRKRYDGMEITWGHVVRTLLA